MKLLMRVVWFEFVRAIPLEQLKIVLLIRELLFDKDNRIPSYGMNYEEARKRNALPVPADQYGNPDPVSAYNHWDEITLNPPPGAETATVEMLYQHTSWE